MAKGLVGTPNTAGQACVLNIPAMGENGRIELEGITFGYDGLPTGGLVTIESPVGTVIDKFPVTNSGPGPINYSGTGLAGPPGAAMRLTLAAAGGSVTGYISARLRMDGVGIALNRPSGA